MSATVPTPPPDARRATTPQPQHAAQIADALLRLRTVQAVTGLSKTTINTLVLRRDFPQPIQRGNRCARWRLSDVMTWLQTQGQPLVAAVSEKNSRPEKETALIALREDSKGNSAATQRERMLQALHRHAAVSTIEARRFLDILHPAGRAMELRRTGVNIATLWRTVVTEAGVRHRVGLYVLLRGEGA
jgi:predicted DNA-binding transcriptional regulator AlpA